jgi:asparagine synthetase B (glutamine-hydrolysing)
VTVRRWWHPDFRSKERVSLNRAADQLIDVVQQSIRRKTRDRKRLGLFLSGGMDTRFLLANFAAVGELPICLTINAFENREVQVARECAQTVGAEHVFLETRPGHYARNFRLAAEVSGGHHVLMAMFPGHGALVEQRIDVAFHGHGFDYMFQGMYLPRRQPKILGRTLYVRWPEAVPSDIVGYFLERVPYRSKGVGVDTLGDPVKVARHRQRQREELEAARRRIGEYTDRPEDVLEQLTFHNLARHYSCSDHWGINVLAEQRTISFDNDVYDFYQKVPTEYRFDARVQRRALVRLAPALADLPSANNRFPIRLPSSARTLHQVADSILRHVGVRSPSDDRFERMGLPFGHLLATEWRDRVEALLRSDRLEALEFLDLDALRRWVGSCLDTGQFADSTFLVTLLVIDHYLALRPN